MLRYAWMSFTRQRTRSSLAISGIALSVALLIAVLSISNSVQQAIASALGAAGADMVVQRRVKPCPFAPIKLPKDLAEIKADVVQKLEAMEQVESVSGVLLLWAFYEGHPTVVAGIDPEGAVPPDGHLEGDVAQRLQHLAVLGQQPGIGYEMDW